MRCARCSTFIPNNGSNTSSASVRCLPYQIKKDKESFEPAVSTVMGENNKTTKTTLYTVQDKMNVLMCEIDGLNSLLSSIELDLIGELPNQAEKKVGTPIMPSGHVERLYHSLDILISRIYVATSTANNIRLVTHGEQSVLRY